MSISLKADPSGTFGEILVNGAVVAKLPVTGNAVIPGLVGTVSQSGGVPTGAIIERGNNANGSYVRFADGTQICWLILTKNSVAIDQAFYGNFRSALQSWTFPAVFVGLPVVVTNAAGDSALGSGVAGTFSGSSEVFFTSAISVVSSTRYMVQCAIGRWF